jgi:hypothetical protein
MIHKLRECVLLRRQELGILWESHKGQFNSNDLMEKALWHLSWYLPLDLLTSEIGYFCCNNHLMDQKNNTRTYFLMA